MGVHLGPGRGYRLRLPRHAYGTASVVQAVRRCAIEVADRFPGTADVLVGDISKPAGGRFPPHQSHQSGRDVDVGYYLTGNRQNATMFRLKSHELDYAKNWAHLRCMLRRGRVVRVYMDTAIQRGYVSYLKKKGMGDGLLKAMFETEGGQGALVLHAPKHDTHLHVRYACDSGDSGCSEDRGDTIFERSLP